MKRIHLLTSLCHLCVYTLNYIIFNFVINYSHFNVVTHMFSRVII